MYKIVPAIDSVIRMNDMLVIPRVDGNSDYEDFKHNSPIVPLLIILTF